jgi:hypothetical protein
VALIVLKTVTSMPASTLRRSPDTTNTAAMNSAPIAAPRFWWRADELQARSAGVGIELTPPAKHATALRWAPATAA